MNLEITPRISKKLKEIGRAGALLSVTATLLLGCDQGTQPRAAIEIPTTSPAPTTFMEQDSETISSVVEIVNREMVAGISKQQRSITTEEKNGEMVPVENLSIRVESLNGANHILEASIDLEDKGPARIFLVPRIQQPMVEKDAEGNYRLIIHVFPIIYGLTNNGGIFAIDVPEKVQEILDESPTTNRISAEEFYELTGIELESVDTDTTFGNFVFSEGAVWRFDSDSNTWSISVKSAP